MKTILFALAMGLALWSIDNICYATDYSQDPYCQGAWLFEEGMGTAVEDDSLNSNTGMFRGIDEPAWSINTPGSFSSYCVDFDGSNDYVDVGSGSSLDDLGTFTFVTWIKLEGTPGYSQGGIFEKGSGSQERKYIRDLDIGSGDQDQIGVKVDCASRDARSSSKRREFSDGSWYHLGVSYDDSSDRIIRIYKNGTELSSYSRTAGEGAITIDEGYSWFIGGSPPNAFYAFNGKMDEVAIFSRVLSKAEINEIMNEGLKGSSTNTPPTPEPSAGIPNLIRFQAALADTQGLSLDGTYTIIFRLYDCEIGGIPIWGEAQQDVFIEEGALDVELGSVTALDLPFDKQYWLGVEVESDGEMYPRFKLTTVPYAFQSAQ